MAAMKMRTFWIGLLMVVAGAVWFAESAGVLRLGAGWAALLFAVGGVGFAVVFAREREAWWAAIPAGALLGIASVIAWEEVLSPGTTGEWSGALFLGLLGAGFLAVYARSHERWWAIIPGGVLVSLALMVVATTLLSELQAVAVLFGGMALTFAALTVLPTDGQSRRWALIPAIPFAVLATFFAADAVFADRLLEYAWPVVLVAGGLYVLWRAGADRRGSPHS